MNWQCLPWEELDRDLLYQIVKTRFDIFVLEQKCFYPEFDNLDQKALHIVCREEGELLAYARVFPPGAYYEEVAIGRVLVSDRARGRGMMKALIKECHREVLQRFDTQRVRLNAQAYLQSAYEGLGYQVLKGPYNEDGIDHYEMVRS